MRSLFLCFASLVVAAVQVASISTYDYVVIGGGTAGITIASRLTENKDVTVAVIEAGFNAEGLPEVFIPGFIGMGIAFTTLDWSYATIPQANLNGRTLTVNAGKALGGSTIINSMIFSRAEKEQYDAWGQLNNDNTWTWSALLPFFKKSELFTPPNVFQVANGVNYLPSVHGFNQSEGRVKVGFPNFFFEQSALWRKAAEFLGFAASPDLADGNPHAVGVAPNSIDAANNTRCSAACAYYTPFADRENLVVITNATVSRILWANSSAQGKLVASGVEFILTSSNETQTVGVSKEVVVSAGTIGSPKVLELSGVGNSTILKTAGVTPVLDLPTVGENFADHVHSWANSFTNITLTKDALLLNTAFAAEQKALWFQNRTGLYSALPRSLGIAAPSDVFTPSQLGSLIAQAEANLTHFATEFSNGNPALARGIAAQHSIALALYKENKELPLEMNLEPGYSGPTSFAARPARNYTTINSVLYAPLSRGRTHIVSSNPLTPPAVDPAYWAHPLDVAAQVGGIKLARRMLVAPPLNSIYNGEFEPGADKSTDGEIEDWLRGVVASDNHEVGSCSMMPQALGGVVDTQLRVYGTMNVRVADASIIPFPVSSHLSSTVYMIGERAADIIQGGKA
ncbi:alcohol oxidase [Roridomyces roridus]|uniref:Alcohol oxidase n=1 Tax=Roridomyces roridus TaxID=1738132 RepID=A0AAD7BQ66_9AGAR|nr:alcohol oxidase [Roridomyces roridus]